MKKENRQQNWKIFWEVKGEEENKFIDQYNYEQKLKLKNDNRKMRDYIVKQSFWDYKEQDKRYGGGKEIIEKMKKEYLQSLIRKQKRKNILDEIEIECESWISNCDSGNYKERVLIPNVYFDDGNFYNKLQ